MRRSSIVVRATWDPEAEVWIATSDDVPGLITEAASQPELIAKLSVMVPELIEMNDDLRGTFEAEIPVYVMSEHMMKVRVPA
jgi:hypothetical protein